MKILILASIFALARADQGYLRPVLPYNYLGVPLSYDGRVLDTPEVAQAKAAHLATQAYEAARNTYGIRQSVPLSLFRFYPGPGAPIGADGNVVDTPEVAEAKAAHFTAHALVIMALWRTLPCPTLMVTDTLHPSGQTEGW